MEILKFRVASDKLCNELGSQDLKTMALARHFQARLFPRPFLAHSELHKYHIKQLQAVNIVNIPLDISKKILVMKMMT